MQWLKSSPSSEPQPLTNSSIPQRNNNFDVILLQTSTLAVDITTSAVPRGVFILLNRYGCPKNEPKFLKTSPFFNFNQLDNCPFFLPNYFI